MPQNISFLQKLGVDQVGAKAYVDAFLMTLTMSNGSLSSSSMSELLAEGQDSASEETTDAGDEPEAASEDTDSMAVQRSGSESTGAGSDVQDGLQEEAREDGSGDEGSDMFGFDNRSNDALVNMGAWDDANDAPA